MAHFLFAVSNAYKLKTIKISRSYIYHTFKIRRKNKKTFQVRLRQHDDLLIDIYKFGYDETMQIKLKIHGKYYTHVIQKVKRQYLQCKLFLIHD